MQVFRADLAPQATAAVDADAQPAADDADLAIVRAGAAIERRLVR